MDFSKIIGMDELAPFGIKHELQKQLDPAATWKSQSYKGKVVIITGGATGVGGAAATAYARAGADLVLVGRRKERLEDKKDEIVKELPDARVEIVAGDISQPDVPKLAVETAVKVFGRVDIAIANAGTGTPPIYRLGESDPLAWRAAVSTNIFGTYGLVNAALPELVKTTGQIIVTGSSGAFIRFPFGSDYIVSKHALNRLVELLAVEYPDVKAYIVQPGSIPTEAALTAEEISGMKFPREDTAETAAAFYLWLTSRNAEFLSGRYVDATWDIEELLAKKDEIVRDNLLVTKLAGPAKAT
ncbi:NAD(P)-binding protein [Peniophora sp. CONT]|nr:NAD(P)-binding protein [Peniophora sp. CONT]